MTDQSAVAREIAEQHIQSAPCCSECHDDNLVKVGRANLKVAIFQALTRAREEGAGEMRERAAATVKARKDHLQVRCNEVLGQNPPDLFMGSTLSKQLGVARLIEEELRALPLSAQPEAK